MSNAKLKCPSCGNEIDINLEGGKCNTCNTRAKNSNRDLKIRQRYSFHKDVVQRIIKNGYILYLRRQCILYKKGDM